MPLNQVLNFYSHNPDNIRSNSRHFLQRNPRQFRSAHLLITDKQIVHLPLIPRQVFFARHRQRWACITSGLIISIFSCQNYIIIIRTAPAQNKKRASGSLKKLQCPPGNITPTKTFRPINDIYCCVCFGLRLFYTWRFCCNAKHPPANA